MISAIDPTTYADALTRIQALWNAGASQIGHPDHAEFEGLYAAITVYEVAEGLSAPQDQFQIDTLERLQWFVGKKADLQSRKVRLKAQYDAMLRDIERNEEHLDWRYAAQAEQVLRANLSKGKSLKLLTGTVGLRKTAARVGTTDDAALLRALEAAGGDLATVIEPKINLTALNRLIKIEGDTVYLVSEGTIAELPGLSIKPATETFFVKAGKEGEGTDQE
ncbi:host-nuclease inhibitor Gam family protein [Deinococcus gobiensis]|nr:host-nuclease inhibitor Gam family protein [Deinococcus gobiensis]